MKYLASVYDEFLSIQTESEEIDYKVDRMINHYYSPTKYSVIEDLFIKYPFNNDDHLIDFGCGKGRVLIMAAYHGCKYLTGYEIDTDRYNLLLNNIECFQNTYNNHSEILVFNISADKINIDDSANKFFFFNPFHLKIYMKVINEIGTSLKRKTRKVYLFLYKPQVDTIKYIDSLDYFKKVEIKECHEEMNSNLHDYFEIVVYASC